MQSQVRSARAGARSAFQPSRPLVVARPHQSSTRTRAAPIAAAVAASPEQVLINAARTQSVPPAEVQKALTALETASSSKSGNYDTVPGTWRLLFSTASKIEALQYIPITEYLTLNLTTKVINLESDLGPFAFLIKGTVFSWDPQTGVLDFQFNRGVTVRFFGKQIWETMPKTQRKTYTFYHVTPEVAAAKSSQGGLSLLTR